MPTARISTSPSPSAPLEDLEAWARAVEAEVEQLRQEMLPIEERLAAAREKLDLIRRLIGLAANSPTIGPGRQQRAHDLLASGVEDHIEAVLSEKGAPMHISALRDALIARGAPLPGRGDEANIIVRLRRDEGRFTRTGRGMYGLAAWGLDAVAPTRRVKAPRRRSAR
jgi:hypothetical protein